MTMTTSLPDLNELAARVGAADRAARSDPSCREALVEALLEFCEGLLEQHEFEHAASASAEAMRAATQLVEEGRSELSVTLGVAMRLHADALVELDESERALELYASALRLLEDLDQGDTRAQAELGRALLDYGEALRRNGRVEEALQVLDRALGSFDSQVPSFALTQLQRGKALAELGKIEEAVAATREAVAVCHDLSELSPQLHAQSYADALDALATLLRSLGRIDEAIEPAENSLEVITRLAHDDAHRYLYPLARLTNNLARCYQQAKRFDRAAALFERAVDGFRILADTQPHAHRLTMIQVMSNHALARAQIGELERAHAIASETLELAQAERSWALLPLITGARQFLADLSEDLGRPDEAVAHLIAGMRLLHEAIAEGLPGAGEAAARLGASTKAASTKHGIALPEDVLRMLDG